MRFTGAHTCYDFDAIFLHCISHCIDVLYWNTRHHTQSLCSCFLSGVACAMGGSRNHRGWDGTDFDMGTETQIQTQEKHKSERNLPKQKHTSPHEVPWHIFEVVLPNTLYIVQSLRCAPLYSCTLCSAESAPQTLQRLHQVHQEKPRRAFVHSIHKTIENRFWNNFKREMTSKIAFDM